MWLTDGPEAYIIFLQKIIKWGGRRLNDLGCWGVGVQRLEEHVSRCSSRRSLTNTESEGSYFLNEQHTSSCIQSTITQYEGDIDRAIVLHNSWKLDRAVEPVPVKLTRSIA